ncbi:MAG: glycosyltransferase [Ignavibacteria bacterium]
MKKVLIIDENLPYLLNNVTFPTGGASIQSYNWLKGFLKNNCEVAIFSNADIENKSSYKIIRIDNRNVINSLLKKFINFYSIYKSVKIFSPNIIYVSIPGWHTLVWGIISKVSNAFLIQRISNDFMVDDRFIDEIGRLKYFMFLRGIYFVNVILVQNSYQQENIKNKFPKKNILKLYNPFSIQNNKMYFGMGNYVAWIGLFQRKKNLSALLNIAKILPDIKFKIAGKTSGNIDEITKIALEELQCLPNVEFVGLLPRIEILDFLDESFCLLNTSYYEGFSNTFLEAIMVNTPIVTLKTNDPDKIIVKHNLGLVSEDFNSLPECILKIIREGKRKYNKKGKEYIEKYHDPDLLVKKLFLLMNTLNTIE